MASLTEEICSSVGEPGYDRERMANFMDVTASPNVLSDVLKEFTMPELTDGHGERSLS